MSSTEITRLSYYERQFLRVQDFKDEQAYHIGMRRRLNISHHTWGIVTGLEIQQIEKEGGNGEFEYYVTPGVAIDGYGREIIVLSPVTIDPLLFKKFPDSDYYSIWISYSESRFQDPSPGYEVCGVADQRSRVQESYRLCIGTPNAEHGPIVVAGELVDPTDPATPEDLSIPYQELPEFGVDDAWFIRLGSAQWDRTKSMLIEGTADRINEDRTYVADIASQILAPTDTLVMRRRIPDATLDPADPQLTVIVEGDMIVENDLQVEGDAAVAGELVVTGNTTLEADLEVGGNQHLTGNLTVDGKVGVGTATPDVTVHIATGTNAALAQGTGYLLLGSISGNNVVLDDNEIMARTGVAAATLHLQASGGDLEVHANKNDDREKVIVKDNGHVGIGTVAPDVPLHVTGGTDATLSNGSGYVVIGDVSSTNLVLDNNEITARNNQAAATLSFQRDNGDVQIHSNRETDAQIIFKDSGNTGIGTTNPAGKLDVYGRILRQGQEFSRTGTAVHNTLISTPWGTTSDWNIFVSPNSMGEEEPNSERDNALLMMQCSATPVSSTTWQITARYKFKYTNASNPGNGTWKSGVANYMLVPR